MIWQLSMQVMVLTDDMMPVASPPNDLQPCFQFHDAADLLTFLEAIGRVADDQGAFEKSADPLEQ